MITTNDRKDPKLKKILTTGDLPTRVTDKEPESLFIESNLIKGMPGWKDMSWGKISGGKGK